MPKPNFGSVPILTTAVDVNGDSITPANSLSYALANNVPISSGGSLPAVTGIKGGSYILAISATAFNGATIKLQVLLPDGSTWVDLTGASATSNTPGIGIVLGSNSSVRLAATGGAPTGVYATLS